MSAVGVVPSSPALDRLDRTGRSLLNAVALRTALWFAATLAATIAVLAALDVLLGFPAPVRVFALPAAVIAAALVARWSWRRGRSARSRQHVALWIEERVPSLRYSLATLADPRVAIPGAAELERVVGGADWSGAVRAATTRTLAGPFSFLIPAALLLLYLPPATVVRVVRPRPGDVLDAAAALRGRVSSLTPLVATVIPPAYARRDAVVVEEPAAVSGLAGSDVTIEGRGSPSRIRAVLGDSAIVAQASGARWQVRFRMPDGARALRLANGAAERLVTIEPVPDSAPVVTLRAPAHDTVFRTPAGEVTLAADAKDDIGIAETRFEYIITSGEMESFTFRTGVVASAVGAPLVGAPRGSVGAPLVGALEMRASLSLAALALRPGDVVHLRAVATDQNNVTGPGRGASETRTIRIARTGEYDSVSVEGLPSILGDTAALSERMLIMLAEALERRRPRLARDTVVAESRDIAVDQARLRRRVSDIVFMRLSGESGSEESEGADSAGPMTPEQVMAAAESAAAKDQGASLDFTEDESPVVAVNRPLLEAYNAMWEAGRWLEIGEPDDALPHMRAALAAIQRARQAERIYLRGRPATQVVDVRDARLKGERPPPQSAPRFPSAALGAERAKLAARLSAALSLARAAPADAADSLLLIRLDALGRYPSFAAAAARAAVTLRAGGEATAQLLRARDALLGEPRHTGTLSPWSVAP